MKMTRENDMYTHWLVISQWFTLILFFSSHEAVLHVTATQGNFRKMEWAVAITGVASRIKHNEQWGSHCNNGCPLPSTFCFTPEPRLSLIEATWLKNIILGVASDGINIIVTHFIIANKLSQQEDSNPRPNNKQGYTVLQVALTTAPRAADGRSSALINLYLGLIC